MTEHRLFNEGEVPYFTTPEFFAGHPWVPPGHQIGHAERTAMTAKVVREFFETAPVHSVIELGCGDGALYEEIKDLPCMYVGWDACTASVDQARSKGMNVNLGDIRKVPTAGYDLGISCEVIEHMADPHGFVASVKTKYLVLTSPVAEDAEWHYEHHAWAWDEEGYAHLAIEGGWKVLAHQKCTAPEVTFAGGTRHQGFQCLLLERVE